MAIHGIIRSAGGGGSGTITGDLSVSGNSAIAGNETVGGTLGVTGVTTSGGVVNTGRQVESGIIRPAAITGTVDDWAPTGLSGASTIIASTSGAVLLDGLTGGVEGRRIVLFNTGTFSLTIVNESSGSAAANRFSLAGAENWVLGATGNSTATFEYDGTAARWKMISKTGTSMPSLTVTGAASVGTTLGVTGATTLSGGTTATGTVALGTTTTGTTTVSGPLAASQTLGVTGVTTLSGGTTASGNVALGTTTTGTTSVAGPLTAAQTLGVTGVTTLSGGTTATGTVALGTTTTGTTTVSGPLSAAQTLSVTGASTLGAAVSFSATATATGVTGTLDDYAPTGIGTAATLDITTSGTTTLDGISAGQVAGRLLTLRSNASGTSNITIVNAAAGSSAANRFLLPGASNLTLTVGNAYLFQYDGSNWRLIASGNTRFPTIVDDGALSVTGTSTLATTLITSNLTVSGVISPTALSGSSNDYNPATFSTTSLIRQDVSSASTLTGLIAAANGRIITIVNIATAAANSLTLNNEDAASTAANRFTLPNGVAWRIAAGGAVTLRYDGTSSRWRPVSSVNAAPTITTLTVTGNSGFFGTAAAAKPTVTGAKLPSDVALASLLTGLASLGLVTDSTT